MATKTAVPRVRFSEDQPPVLNGHEPARETGDMEAQEWLYDVDDIYLACRGQRHAFPKLVSGKALPRGVRTVGPYRDGVMELIWTCPDCKTKRRVVTAPHAVLEPKATYSYKHPRGYKSPKGSKITPRQCLAETMRRIGEELWAGAAPPPKED